MYVTINMWQKKKKQLKLMNILLKNETIKKHTHTNILYLPKMNNGKTNKAITIQIFTYIYITMYNENEKVSLTKLKTI